MSRDADLTVGLVELAASYAHHLRCLRRVGTPSHPTPFLEENPRAIALTPQPFAQANHRNVPPFFKKESSLYGGNNC
ncbi:hypothetical protein [Nostoc sp.]|uniref:hypothetical protein n=1 Tax=Nostoc sp. TaxID=1180 RepID=UPI002FF924B8